MFTRNCRAASLSYSHPKYCQDSLDLPCVTSSAISELYRGIRQQAPSLLGISEENMGLMSLGLAHSLSRYKLKFSPDKVDTMIIQAICKLFFAVKENNRISVGYRT